jgi:16S rRNA pseudouridine516 synthase
MRLDKYVSIAAGVSRKEAALFIRGGRVLCDGKVCRDGSTAAGETVTLDGEPLEYAENVYILMNKPAGYVCEGGRADSVFTLLPRETARRKGLSVCGRLDKDTEGLLLISDDGDFVHRIISPKKHIEKVYFARLASPAKLSYAEAFESGMEIDGGDCCRPAKLFITENKTDVFVTLTEGMYHQVKRMFFALGNEVTYLKRIKTGGLSLPENLLPGEFKPLSEEERERIFAD